MDSHRLRAGPLNENIADIMPLLEYTSTSCNIPALPAYYTSGLYYQPWNQVLRTYLFAARSIFQSAVLLTVPYWRLPQNNTTKEFWFTFPNYFRFP